MRALSPCGTLSLLCLLWAYCLRSLSRTLRRRRRRLLRRPRIHLVVRSIRILSRPVPPYPVLSYPDLLHAWMSKAAHTRGCCALCGAETLSWLEGSFQWIGWLAAIIHLQGSGCVRACVPEAKDTFHRTKEKKRDVGKAVGPTLDGTVRYWIAGPDQTKSAPQWPSQKRADNFGCRPDSTISTHGPYARKG